MREAAPRYVDDTERARQKPLIKERTALFGHVLGKRYSTALQPWGSTR